MPFRSSLPTKPWLIHQHCGKVNGLREFIIEINQQFYETFYEKMKK